MRRLLFQYIESIYREEIVLRITSNCNSSSNNQRIGRSQTHFDVLKEHSTLQSDEIVEDELFEYSPGERDSAEELTERVFLQQVALACQALKFEQEALPGDVAITTHQVSSYSDDATGYTFHVEPVRTNAAPPSPIVKATSLTPVIHKGATIESASACNVSSATECEENISSKWNVKQHIGNCLERGSKETRGNRQGIHNTNKSAMWPKGSEIATHAHNKTTTDSVRLGLDEQSRLENVETKKTETTQQQGEPVFQATYLQLSQQRRHEPGMESLDGPVEFYHRDPEINLLANVCSEGSLEGSDVQTNPMEKYESESSLLSSVAMPGSTSHDSQASMSSTRSMASTSIISNADEKADSHDYKTNFSGLGTPESSGHLTPIKLFKGEATCTPATSPMSMGRSSATGVDIVNISHISSVGKVRKDLLPPSTALTPPDLRSRPKRVKRQRRQSDPHSMVDPQKDKTRSNSLHLLPRRGKNVGTVQEVVKRLSFTSLRSGRSMAISEGVLSEGHNASFRHLKHLFTSRRSSPSVSISSDGNNSSTPWYIRNDKSSIHDLDRRTMVMTFFEPLPSND